MIGSLKGRVDAIGDDWVLIDVGGVGYEVHCPSRILNGLPPVGEVVQLAIETHVRETEIRLFGFKDNLEREWFRKLQSVQGVGAKVALAILGTLSLADLGNAISLQDKAIVARAPGVGPKVAGRIVSELKDKVPAGTGIGGIVSPASEGAVAGGGPSPAADAVSALVNLGYQSSDAAQAVAKVFAEAGEDCSVEALIRLSLKELAK